MSRIYFHSPDADAEVRGWERAHCGGTVDRIAWSWLNTFRARERYERLLPANHYLRQTPIKEYAWAETFKTAVAGIGETPLHVGDREVSSWVLALNTVVVLGSPTLTFMARVHATCEIHGYVEGEHRHWLAGIIADGRTSGLLRPESGWEDVVTLLRSRDDEPVVMSYSVTESFPSVYALPSLADEWLRGSKAGQSDDERYDEWYDTPPDEQWSLAMRHLREARAGVDLHPDTFASRHFGHDGMTVFDLEQWLDDTPAAASTSRREQT